MSDARAHVFGSHDRQETPQQVEVAMRLLHAVHERFTQLPDTLPSPATRSVLHEERRHTRREMMDGLVIAHRARAMENLERLFAIMIDEQTRNVSAYPFSSYALIRASIENAATALWIIQSERKANRVLRSLQITYRNTLERLNFVKLLAGQNDGLEREVERARRAIDRLNELKDTAGALRQKELGYPPKYTNILEAVSTRDRTPGARHFELASPLTIWKISSAFLHGSDDVIRSLSDVRQQGEFIDGTAHFEVTPNMQLQTAAIAQCVDLIDRIDARYTHLATHDHAGRPVTSQADTAP